MSDPVGYTDEDRRADLHEQLALENAYKRHLRNRGCQYPLPGTDRRCKICKGTGWYVALVGRPSAESRERPCWCTKILVPRHDPFSGKDR